MSMPKEKNGKPGKNRKPEKQQGTLYGLINNKRAVKVASLANAYAKAFGEEKQGEFGNLILEFQKKICEEDGREVKNKRSVPYEEKIRIANYLAVAGYDYKKTEVINGDSPKRNSKGEANGSEELYAENDRLNEKRWSEEPQGTDEALRKQNEDLVHQQLDLEKTLNVLKREKKLFDMLGFFPETGAGERPQKREESCGLSELTDYVHDYAASGCYRAENLYYEKDVIRRFLAATLTGQLIILCGPTGTGKTTLPGMVAAALGGQCRFISVQSNWMDDQDLLGFYNVREGRYVPTDFLDALADARKDEDIIYYIVLDEMNLTRTEYYFAKYLSAMETDKKKLTLYNSQMIEVKKKQLREKIENVIKRREMEEQEAERFKKGTSTKQEKVSNIMKLSAEEMELKTELEWLESYPPELVIPDNVQIVGTLNMDETTKNLSPKVIDRSYVIELRENGDTVDAVEKPDEKYYSRAIFAGMKDALPDDGHLDGAEVEKSIIDIVQAWNGAKGDGSGENEPRFELRISRRSGKHIREIAARYGNKMKNDLVTDILLGKVLPALKGTEISQEVKDTLKSQIEKDHPIVSDKIDRMFDKEMMTLNYWKGM